jgi:OOP family OmpA-OmpF porin
MMDLVRASPIQFAFHSAQIERSSYAVLDALSETAKKCPAASIEVAGHTVDFRRKSYNRNLSRRRAEAVAAYLAEAGVDATRLTATGYGDSMPVAPNDTDEGQAKNRRIEFNLK